MFVFQSYFASVKTLCELLNIEKGTAEQIRSLVKGNTKAERYPCGLPLKDFHRLPRPEKILWAINGLLDEHGVESFDNGSSDPRYFKAVPYVNNGDSHKATILYMNGIFQVASQANIIEGGIS